MTNYLSYYRRTRFPGGVGGFTPPVPFYIRSISIDHTKCGSSNSTNFPLFFSGTYSYLATTANGGNVTSSSGYDINFYSDSLCTTLLPYERLVWNATTGQSLFWVKIPTLSSSADTVIYLQYGNPLITSDQQNNAGVWANYNMVSHMYDLTTSTLKDETSNNMTLNKTSAGNPAEANGKLYKAQNYSSDGVTISDHAGLDITTGGFSWWGNWNTWDANVRRNFIRLNRYTSWCDQTGGNRQINFGNFIDTNLNVNVQSYIGVGEWHHIALTTDGSNHKLFIDGVQRGTQGIANSMSTGGENLELAFYSGAGPGQYLDGNQEEFRISASGTVLTADYFLSEYNNQNAPVNFYTISNPL